MIIIGIYKITSPNNRIYIGQSRNIETRFKQYQTMHSSGKNQIKLWRSLLKYGVDKHTFEIIEECTFKELNCKERYWQDFYDVLDREKGLNLILTKTNDKPKKVSEETKQKISRAHKGKIKGPFTQEHKEKISKANLGKKTPKKTKDKMSTPVIQLNKENDIIKEFSSITQAENITGILATGITRVCKGKRKTAGGFFWKYKDETKQRKYGEN